MAEAMAAPETTVMVGDSSIDVRTGRAAGARTVGVRYGFDPESMISEPPDALFGTLGELPAFVESLPSSVLR
jgi:phosphoglycolate phosphatase